ncbi:MAG TPA: ABC transporter substrate-binding protein [Solirubrobacteraceae bacterium]|nr:ABC transporter substrate-binding protein [Solirubrobacteraceae bacterium]
MRSFRFLSLSACAAALLAATAAGGAPSALAAGSTVDRKAAALVPKALASKGTVTVAADASYAPNEFIASNGHTVIGMDADLAKALFADLGLKVDVVNATFDTIIPGLQAGKYDIGMSSFTDTKAREKVVNFVDYFEAGTSFFEKAQGGPKVTNLASLCGLTVSVETGTTEQSDADGQAKKCPSGKKLTVLPFPTQNEANLALSSGRAQVSMADSPVAAYQVKQSHGEFKLTGQTYGTAPYGIAVPKSYGKLDQAILLALKDLIKNGDYMKLLQKWGVQSGADTHPAINGAIS